MGGVGRVTLLATFIAVVLVGVTLLAFESTFEETVRRETDNDVFACDASQSSLHIHQLAALGDSLRTWKDIPCPVRVESSVTATATELHIGGGERWSLEPLSVKKCPVKFCFPERTYTKIPPADCLELIEDWAIPPRLDSAERLAFATLVHKSDDYCRMAAALVLNVLSVAKEFSRTDPPVFLILGSGLSDSCVGALSAVGGRVINVPPFLVDTSVYFQKLWMWTFTEYSRIMFLDADMLVRDSHDLLHCFALPGLTAPVAWESPLWGEFMIIEPSCEAARDLARLVERGFGGKKIGWGALRVPLTDYPAQAQQKELSDWSFFGAADAQGLLYFYYGLRRSTLWRVRMWEGHLLSFSSDWYKPWGMQEIAKTDHKMYCRRRDEYRREEFDAWNRWWTLLQTHLRSADRSERFAEFVAPEWNFPRCDELHDNNHKK